MGQPLPFRLHDLENFGPGYITLLNDIYLTPHLLDELGPFETIILIKILPYGYDGIGLDKILIYYHELISCDKLGYVPGIFGGLEVDIIFVIIVKLEL